MRCTTLQDVKLWVSEERIRSSQGINLDNILLRACIRACIRACVRACVRASERAHGCVCPYGAVVCAVRFQSKRCGFNPHQGRSCTSSLSLGGNQQPKVYA